MVVSASDNEAGLIQPGSPSFYHLLCNTFGLLVIRWTSEHGASPSGRLLERTLLGSGLCSHAGRLSGLFSHEGRPSGLFSHAGHPSAQSVGAGTAS